VLHPELNPDSDYPWDIASAATRQLHRVYVRASIEMPDAWSARATPLLLASRQPAKGRRSSSEAPQQRVRFRILRHPGAGGSKDTIFFSG